MTYLEIVNQVLTLLREKTVSTVTQDTYSSLIGVLVNQVKQYVEDRYDWSALRSTILAPTTDGISGYILTSAGNRSRFWRDQFGRPSVWNNTTKEFLLPNRSGRWMTQQMLSNTNTGVPKYFDINGVMTDVTGTANYNPRVDLYPTPDGEYDIHFNLVVPQEDLDADSDILLIPHHVVILGAWAKAISERGEDGGANSSEVHRDFMFALNTAIQLDSSFQQDELVSTVE